MSVTIHADHPAELVDLIRDLRTLDGGSALHVRRAVHGTGAIVDEELALLWLTLRLAPSPQFLESLIRADPALEDVVGRRASDEALQELARWRGDQVASAPAPAPQPVAEISPPGKKAPKSEWEYWATVAGLMSATEAGSATKAQLQALVSYSGQSAPDNTKEG